MNKNKPEYYSLSSTSRSQCKINSFSMKVKYQVPGISPPVMSQRFLEVLIQTNWESTLCSLIWATVGRSGLIIKIICFWSHPLLAASTASQLGLAEPAFPFFTNPVPHWWHSSPHFFFDHVVQPHKNAPHPHQFPLSASMLLTSVIRTKVVLWVLIIAIWNGKCKGFPVRVMGND